MNPDLPLQLLGGMTAREFMRDYWQKKPLLIRQAIPDFESPIDADELAGLALEEEVESRLVIEHGERPWELRRGPFAEDEFGKLPEREWTLLVQAVDQFVPEVGELLEHFRFLPSWRIDDVMISYAAPGGSVGPHFDNYDVFLLQGAGQRHWQIGQMCDSDSALLEHADLRILADFQATDEWTLEPGDMLYLPPRLAHSGVAVDDCLTYSVGFRAPSAAEVLTHFTDFLSQYLPNEERYTDADAQPVSEPHQIQRDALDRLKGLLAEHMSDERMLLTWFGQFMTEPRYPELVVGPELEEEDLLGSLDQGAVLIRNPSARLAWSEVDEDLLLFASGQSRLLPGKLRDLLKMICAADALHAENLGPWLADEDGRNLLCELVKQGSLGFADE
ncbi:cupin [Pseudomonas lundensis]|uniref:ribosomal protein uL16 3-hydroxylase n=1 Tax=Pseudomonas lundensis TaxID=86185 RepID=UPI000641FD6C|nr:cupin domain-containing protein [Pseudomonas lundensis]AOZ11577.1 cupin [Pseudomonas lundensis]QVQ77354.1 cupin domain-containing protein [Pseudomonas lundensis]QVQ83581.1 cupin domain-containing protein [Pseudomonas lundensis]